MSAPLRIVFFGTPAFAVPTLEALLASRHPVAGVVTQPDRPRGRGQKPSPRRQGTRRSTGTARPAARSAEGSGVPCGIDRVERGDRCGRGVRAHHSRGRHQHTGTGLINVHASLLPRYRGAAPVHRAVLNGDAETGVTIMRIVKELDAGAMFASVVRPIGPDATSGDVEDDLAIVGRPAARGRDRRHRSGHRSRDAAGCRACDLRRENHPGREPDRLDPRRRARSTIRCAVSCHGLGPRRCSTATA